MFRPLLTPGTTSHGNRAYVARYVRMAAEGMRRQSSEEGHWQDREIPL